MSMEYSPDEIPEEEFRLRDKLVFSAAFRANFCHSEVHNSNPWKVVEDLLHYSNNVNKNKDIPVNKLVTSVHSATDWTFVPVGGQHRNGISESTVKVMKKSPALALSPCFSCIC